MIQKTIKPFLLFFILFTSLLVGAQTEKPKSSAFSTYLDAENAFMMEDYSKAMTLYQKVLETDESYDPAMFQLARIYLSRNQVEEAYTWAEKAYKLDTENKWYALLMVDLYKHKSKFEEAIGVYQELLKQEPANNEYLGDLAQLYSLTQQPDLAIETLNKMEKSIGVTEQVSFLKRDLYLNSDRFEPAVLEMVKLSEAFPKNSLYLNLIAEMYMGNNEPEKAFLFYQKILDVNPSDPYIRITLADYYQHKGMYNEAFENLQQGYLNPALELDTKIQILMGLFEIKNIPEDRIRTESLKLAKSMAKVHADQPGSHAIYADLLYRDSLYSEAANEYKAVLKIDSSRYVVWEQLLFSLNNRTETNQIVDYSARAIKQFPTEPLPYLFNAVGEFLRDSTKRAITSLEAGLPFVQNSKLMEQFYMYLGDAYYQENQKEKAFEAYDKCLEINPSNTFVLNNYAYYLALNKTSLDKAKTMAFTAISIAPGATNYDTYGWVLFQLGSYEEALKYIALAIEKDEDPSAEVLDHMGDVYFRLGEEKKAAKYWKKAKKKGLNTPEFIHKLANGLD